MPERGLRRKGKYNSDGEGVEILAGEEITQERQVQFRRERRGNTCLRGDYAGKASTIPVWKAWKYLPEREIHKKGK